MAIIAFPGSPYRLHQPFEPAGDQPAAMPNALMFIDEGHVTISQIGGMYKDGRARKENLVN